MELPNKLFFEHNQDDNKDKFLQKIQKSLNLLLFSAIIKLVYAITFILIFFVFNLITINIDEEVVIGIIIGILFMYGFRTARIIFKIKIGYLDQLKITLYSSYALGLMLGSYAAHNINKEYKLYLETK